MPQYELEAVGPDQQSGLHRGRTPEDAVRRAVACDPTVAIDVADTSSPDGWQSVALDGEPSGRVRLHQRMRFRRD